MKPVGFYVTSTTPSFKGKLLRMTNKGQEDGGDKGKGEDTELWNCPLCIMV